MEYQKHYKILRQGVDIWNSWRDQHPEEWQWPDFSREDLSRLDLSGAYFNGASFIESNLAETKLRHAFFKEAYLRGASLYKSDLFGSYCEKANFRGAWLIKADLRKAFLHEANFIGSRLSEADLSGADITEADLSGANLEEAKLEGADLRGANFFRSFLNGTDLTDAKIGFTVFGNVDLSNVKGLETVQHEAPSTIGIDTIYLSEGKIPEPFLRGAGVPERLLIYLNSLTEHAFEFYSCFISYSSLDKEFAERLYADLQCRGVRCWFAPQDIRIGDKIRDTLDQAISYQDKLLLILSDNSINSEWVEKEVETAFEQERKRNRTMLFPIRLDYSAMETDKAWAADIRRTRHIGDFSKWKENDEYQKALNRLIHNLTQKKNTLETT